jgi:hypothetical protein
MIMTPQEFIENAPLYTRIDISDFSPPASITRMCKDDKCKKETTWLETGEVRTTIKGTRPQVDVQYVAYQCGLCGSRSLGVIYELLNWSSGNGMNWSHKAVRKVGQVPPQEIAIPAELTDRLGFTAGHYRKALLCREQNYGIAAMAYLRRVVDEQTDNLIEVMADLSRTYGVAEETITALLAAKNEGQYKTKLESAAELIPDAVKPGGVNPFGQLYKHTSIGLHSKTDEECIAIFDDLKADFEYVFRNLHLQAEERRQFARRVQARAGLQQS